jgi:outer membrane beta-barrel protein
MKSLSEHHEGPRPRSARRAARPLLQRGFRLGLAVVLTWAATSAVDASRAWALQGGEDPATLPVLIDKRYGLKNRLTAHVQFSTPITSKFVESTGVVGGVDYGLYDWLSVGLVGGFFGGGEADIVDQVRATLGTAPLTDLDRMQWFGGVDVTFTPIYGRISFASEYNPAFDVLAFVGGGALGTERKLGNEVTGTTTETGVTAYGNFGFGFRFHVLDWLALRTEYRQLIHPEDEIPLSEQANSTVDDPSDRGGGLSTAQQFQIGLQFRFDI